MISGSTAEMIVPAFEPPPLSEPPESADEPSPDLPPPFPPPPPPPPLPLGAARMVPRVESTCDVTCVFAFTRSARAESAVLWVLCIRAASLSAPLNEGSSPFIAASAEISP